MNSRVLIAVCVAGWLTAASGCGDSGWAPLYQDGGRQDGNTVADAIEAGNLQPCTTIGEPCNAHDTCAIQPICDDNYLCRPASFQNCDDGLACTDDSCLGLGKCENKPQPGFCVLPVTVNGQTETKCFQAGDTSPDRPCSKCDPSVDPTNWTTSFDAVACDDGNACTKNDSCQAGVCKGEDFSATCSDGLSCTDDGCDGAGGCGPKTIMPGTCALTKPPSHFE